MGIGWPQKASWLTCWVWIFHNQAACLLGPKSVNEPDVWTADCGDSLRSVSLEESWVCHAHLIDLIEGDKWFTEYGIIGGDVFSFSPENNSFSATRYFFSFFFFFFNSLRCVISGFESHILISAASIWKCLTKTQICWTYAHNHST